MNKYFINISTKDKRKLLQYCKEMEDMFMSNILTGVSYAEMKDDSYFLSLVFDNKEEFDKAMGKVIGYDFEKVYNDEEKYLTLIRLAKISVLGNFSSSMMNNNGV